MLKKIDKYIIKKFLSTFFFMIMIIMLLAMVFDIAEKLGDFIDHGATVYGILVKYYLNFVIFYGNMFSSMIIFISVIWFTAKMAQDTEIIPILNSGRKFGRFVRPYLIASTILMLISLVFNHFIVPNANKIRLQFEEDFLRTEMTVVDYYAEFPDNEIVYFHWFGANDQRLYDLKIEKRDENDSLKGFIRAEFADNINDSKRWELHNYFQRVIKNGKERIVEGQVLDTLLQFDVSDIAKRENVAEAMTYFELKELIQKEKAKGNPMVPNYEIEFYQRSSYPFATYVLTIIGISVASRKKRGGIGMSIAIGLGIVFIYIFAMKVTTVSAINLGFPASIAVWVPNILFGGVAYIMYRFAKR